MKSRLFIASLGLATCLGGFATTANAQSLSDRLDGVARQQARSSASEQKAVMLGRLLYSDITVDFDETPARSAIEYFRTVLGVTIIGRFNDDRTGTGIDPDTPITISIRNQPALTALEFVLEQCAAEIDEPCIWQLRNGFIEVGTKERLGRKSARETRYYPIKDMLFNPPNFDNAPDFDLDSAFGQGGGNGNGGGGGGGGFGGGGSGGGGSGGGGRGGGSGGGGSLFSGDVEEVERMSETERAEQIMDLIREIVEPDEWDLNGGESARMRYYQGVLIITAPDFVHRQVNGYPFRPAVGPNSQIIGQANPGTTGRRFVTFGAEGSKVELPDGTRVGVGVDPEESMTMAERAKAQREQRQRDAAARDAARRENTPPPASRNRSGG